MTTIRPVMSDKDKAEIILAGQYALSLPRGTEAYRHLILLLDIIDALSEDIQERSEAVEYAFKQTCWTERIKYLWLTDYPPAISGDPFEECK